MSLQRESFYIMNVDVNARVVDGIRDVRESLAVLRTSNDNSKNKVSSPWLSEVLRLDWTGPWVSTLHHPDPKLRVRSIETSDTRERIRFDDGINWRVTRELGYDHLSISLNPTLRSGCWGFDILVPVKKGRRVKGVNILSIFTVEEEGSERYNLHCTNVVYKSSHDHFRVLYNGQSW